MKTTAISFAIVMALATGGRACPVCESDTGGQVRAGLADDGLGLSVLAIVVPFAVVFGVVAAVHFYPQRTRKQDAA